VALEHMVKNQRNLSAGRVREYVKQMQDGKWSVSNDAAVVCDGEWLNANHRLHAIVESDTEQTILVLSVLDNSILRIMDGGKPRSIADVLKMETGTQYNKHITSIGMLLLAYKKGLLSCGGSNLIQQGCPGMSMKKLVTRQDKIGFLVKNQAMLMDVASMVSGLNEKYGILTVCVAGCAFQIIRDKDGIEKAIPFINSLYSGEGMDGAVKMLRQYLIKDSTQRNKSSTVVRLGMVLKAYISSRNGNIPGQLAIKSNETFPEV